MRNVNEAAFIVTPKCPRHRLTLVWNAELQLWTCPNYPACTYVIPGDPPAAAE